MNEASFCFLDATEPSTELVKDQFPGGSLKRSSSEILQPISPKVERSPAPDMHRPGWISHKYLNIISEAEQSMNNQKSSAYIKNLYAFREEQGRSTKRQALIKVAQSAIDGAVAPASDFSILAKSSKN